MRHGLLDGAILSSFCLEKRLLSGKTPQWDGVAALPLGQLGLELVTTNPETRRVLLPRKGAMPLLHEAIEWHGYGVDQQPGACQEAAAWIKRARDRGLAMPVCRKLLGSSWLAANSLTALAEQPALVEQLWLLLPQGAIRNPVAKLSLRSLRKHAKKTAATQRIHLN